MSQKEKSSDQNTEQTVSENTVAKVSKSKKVKSDYRSDSMKEEYYRKSWKELCKAANTSNTEDVQFMDIVIELANDTQKQKQKHKRNYFGWEFFLIGLAFFNAVSTSLKPSLPDAWIYAVDILCIVISALIAGVTSYKLLISPKDMWLRHMIFYSKITIEADSLFGCTEDYDSLSPEEKIKKFKRKIVTYIKEDYEDFFANMSGNKGAGIQNKTNS